MVLLHNPPPTKKAKGDGKLIKNPKTPEEIQQNWDTYFKQKSQLESEEGCASILNCLGWIFLIFVISIALTVILLA